MDDNIAVVGSGISGLSFSHYCTLQGFKVSVFEKSSNSGGCIHSYPIGEHRYAELGGHTLTHKYRSVIDIIKHYNKTGEIVQIPSLQFMLDDGRRLLPVASKLNFMELLVSVPKLFKLKKEDKSIRDYYSAGLGKKNYEQLMHHAFQAILCQDPDEFPAALLFRKRKADKSFPKKFTLKQGIVGLLGIIADNPSIDVQVNTPVDAIIRENEEYSLWSSGKKVFTASNLCLSTPSDVSSRLLKPIDPELSEALASLEVRKVETILVKAKSPVESLAKRGLIGLDQPYMSALSFKSGEEHYWVFHFKSNRCSRAEKVEVVARALQVAPAQVEVLKEIAYKLPGLKQSDLQKLEWIKDRLAKLNIFLASNYMEGLAIEDCCQWAFKEASRLNALKNQ